MQNAVARVGKFDIFSAGWLGSLLLVSTPKRVLSRKKEGLAVSEWPAGSFESPDR